MLPLPAWKEHGMTVIAGLPDRQPILEVVARLALHNPVQVIVGGNRFDVHQLARIIRPYTIHLDQVLARIRQARPFTCYQAVKLLAETEPTTPLVVIDMLTTFYDENISDGESVRLVGMAVAQLQRLGRQAPVLVALRPSAAATRPGLMKLIQDKADRLYLYHSPAESVQPPLF